MKSRRFAVLACACAGIVSFAPISRAAVVINELVYDDASTDDREFIELYNDDLVNSVAIGGWTIGGFDGTTTNPSATITAGATIAPGGYYVIGNTGVLNVNQVVAANFLENDAETVELKNGATLVDSIAYETNKGPTGSTGYGAANVAQIGPGFFGNHQTVDVGTPSGGTTSTIGRFIDGRDINNNGRDFGVRASTPGTTNTPAGLMTSYQPPDVSASTVGSNLPNYAFSFVGARVIDPTVADANNPNVISAAPGTGKAIVAWDPSGGGNGVATFQSYTPGAAKSFDIKAYLSTENLPLSTNASAVAFRGSEFTFYGIGTTDALANATNLSGQTNFNDGTPPSDTDSGFAGVFWVYEKVGETAVGAGDVSEKLYLVDANDGGDASTGGSSPLDWTVLATVDLSSTASGWFDMGISIDAAGNGVATFDGQTFNFTTSTDLVGSFAVGYRENTQNGADGTPEAYLRPATFTMVPEPASLSLVGLAGLALGRRRRSN